MLRKVEFSRLDLLQGQAAGARDGLGRTISAVPVSLRADRSCPLAALIPGAAGQLLPGDTAVPATHCPSPGSR